MDLKVEDQHNDFDDFLDTLKKYKWIYNYPVTDLLTSRVLENVTDEWKNILQNLSTSDINRLATRDVSKQTEWPYLLREFVHDCRRMSFPCTQNITVLANNAIRLKGVSGKKCMEIQTLSGKIDIECKKLQVDHIVDLGCGVGNLAQVLGENFGYNVLGLELKDSLVKTATSKSTCAATFKQINVKIGEDGNSEVEGAVNDWIAESRGRKACLIGLHTCGDLAASTLRLFASNSLFASLVLMPCCFHKLEVKENSKLEEIFTSFPLSEKLKTTVAKYNGITFLKRPLLRLASQMSAHKWGQMSDIEHKQHAMHVLCRAALQLFAKENDLQLTKVKRKALNKGALKFSSEQLVDNMIVRYDLKDKDGNIYNSSNAAEGVMKIFQQNSDYLHLIEGLTALQCCLQEPADCLMFSDMQQFLTERDLHLNRVELIWDETLSPRSHAIIATRNHTSL